MGNFGFEHPRAGVGAGVPPRRVLRAGLGHSRATQYGEPEVARNRVVGRQEAGELWLMVALETKSGTKDSVILLTTLWAKPQESPASVRLPTKGWQPGKRNFLSLIPPLVLTLIWNRQLER